MQQPCRGSGIVFEKAFNREMKYRGLLSDYLVKPVCIMQYSKTYYHWLTAERDLRNINFPGSGVSLEQIYGEFIPKRTLQNLEQHKNLCYKPLQRLMP